VFRSLIPVKIYGIIISDYYDGYITRYDCKRNTITYMNNVRLPVEEFEKSSAIDLAVKNGWAYDVAGKYWSKNGIKFRHMHWTILEVFEFGNYEGIDVNGKVVIDVGAFVGDTAIYFALKGAKSIIAIEPLPANYEELLDNVNLNGMRNKINVINAALGSKHGVVKVPRNVPVSIRGSSIDMYKKHGIGKLIDIKSITLSDLINEYAIDGNDAMLKMDCEGCEFDVILNDYEHVKLFEEVVFEYHAYAVHRPIAELINTMSNDFNRQTINEGFFRKFFNDYSRDQLGLIRCVKRS
jgi:FkbM family methyltransferase